MKSAKIIHGSGRADSNKKEKISAIPTPTLKGDQLSVSTDQTLYFWRKIEGMTVCKLSRICPMWCVPCAEVVVKKGVKQWF